MTFSLQQMTSSRSERECGQIIHHDRSGSIQFWVTGHLHELEHECRQIIHHDRSENVQFRIQVYLSQMIALDLLFKSRKFEFIHYNNIHDWNLDYKYYDMKRMEKMGRPDIHLYGIVSLGLLFGLLWCFLYFYICVRGHSFVVIVARLGDNRARKGEMWCRKRSPWSRFLYHWNPGFSLALRGTWSSAKIHSFLPPHLKFLVLHDTSDALRMQCSGDIPGLYQWRPPRIPRQVLLRLFGWCSRLF